MTQNIIAALILFLVLPADATRVPAMTLEEHVQASPLIVVGKITSSAGRLSASINRSHWNTWNAELQVLRVLKGNAPERIQFRWEETGVPGAPDYKPGTEMIWLLMRDFKTNSIFAKRPDSTQPLSKLREVEAAITADRARRNARVLKSNGMAKVEVLGNGFRLHYMSLFAAPMRRILKKQFPVGTDVVVESEGCPGLLLPGKIHASEDSHFRSHDIDIDIVSDACPAKSLSKITFGRQEEWSITRMSERGDR